MFVYWEVPRVLGSTDVLRDHGVFIFRGQEVPEDMNIQCLVPKDLNSN